MSSYGLLNQGMIACEYIVRASYTLYFGANTERAAVRTEAKKEAQYVSIIPIISAQSCVGTAFSSL